MTEVPVDASVMDFSIGRRSLQFRIDDDVFEAAPDLAAELAIEFADQAERLTDRDTTNDERVEITRSLVRLLLRGDSADRFIARMRDPERPIGTTTFNNVFKWLFEEYGMRPTGSDSSSSPGSDVPAPGTSSTVSTSDAASTSDDFDSIGSST